MIPRFAAVRGGGAAGVKNRGGGGRCCYGAAEQVRAARPVLTIHEPVRCRVILLVLAASCTTTVSDHALERNVGAALQGVRDRVARTVGPSAPGRLAGLDGRPFLIDLRNALIRLPSTLRLDVPPFPELHGGARLASSAGAAWRPPTTLSRALARVRL